MLLFDAHAFVWLASAPHELSPPARRAIRVNADRLYLSSISALEIALLVKRNRLILPLDATEFIDRALTHHGIQEIPLDRSIATASACLPDIHNDPFDRVIIATARLHGLSLLSKDKLLASYPGIEVIW